MQCITVQYHTKHPYDCVLSPTHTTTFTIINRLVTPELSGRIIPKYYDPPSYLLVGALSDRDPLIVSLYLPGPFEGLGHVCFLLQTQHRSLDLRHHFGLFGGGVHEHDDACRAFKGTIRGSHT